MEETTNQTQQAPQPQHAYSAEKRLGQFWASLETDKVYPAFVSCLQQIESASKDSTNPHFRSKYADLASCMAVVKPALAANDCALAQPADVSEDLKSVKVGNVFMHSSGQYLRWDFTLPLESRVSPHEVGKSATYARRYSLSALGVIAEDDDDGNTGSPVPPNSKQQYGKPQPPATPKTEPKKEAKPTPAAQAPAKTNTEPQQSQSGSELEKIAGEVAAANNNISVDRIYNFLAKYEINKEPEELQVRFLRGYLNDRSWSTVSNYWKASGKSFAECLDDVDNNGGSPYDLPWTVAKPK